MQVKKFRCKAQATLEYAILIGVIVAGLIAMQVYFKRGFQGKIRDSADDIGEQFSPGKTRVHLEEESIPATVKETTTTQGATRSKNLEDRIQIKYPTSYEEVAPLNEEELWYGGEKKK